jgi:hypothetical protein
MTDQTISPELAAALAKAQSAFEAATKGKQNPAFKSRYADLQSVVDAVRPALNAAGIWLMQDTAEADGAVVIETVFVHSSGAQLRAGRLTMPVIKRDPQGYGSALTYARRYSMMTACGIAPEDDDGNAAVTSQNGDDGDAELLDQFQAAALQGTLALQALFKSAKPDAKWWAKHSASLKTAAKIADDEAAAK